MKRSVFAAVLSLLLFAALLAGCGPAAQITHPDSGAGPTQVDLTLWTFPVGDWGNPTAVSNLLIGFHREYPNIRITVEYLDYETGDARIAQAAADGQLPDLVLEGPERLVADWGERGWMADLSDLWHSERADAVYTNVRQACRHSSGAYYEMPICTTAHCMAINYDMFRDAGALQYIDEATHTWTTDGFIQAVQALTAWGQQNVATVYCKSQSGDQGTRALVNNLYGGTFTDEAHTGYTVNSEENRKALQLLYDLEGITIDPERSSGDAISQFCKKETAMCFCWNASVELQQTVNNPDLDFEVFPMAFPAEDGTPKLQCGIWGFGAFDTGSEERIAAAKTFIRYIAENESAYVKAVQTSSYWPACGDIGNIYENDVLMTEYSIFMRMMGDYYQVTPGWAQARTAWWQMLADIAEGIDVDEAVAAFSDLG